MLYIFVIYHTITFANTPAFYSIVCNISYEFLILSHFCLVLDQQALWVFFQKLVHMGYTHLDLYWKYYNCTLKIVGILTNIVLTLSNVL